MLTVIVGSKKRPAAAEELDWERLAPQEVGEIAASATLFGGARVFVLAGALSGAQQDDFLALAEDLVRSPHVFIFEEEKLLKAPAAALQKAGAVIEERKTVKKEYTFDRFGLAAALAARDRKRLWLGLCAALRAGEKAEALAGLLVWKARALGDAALCRQLTFLYHDAHRGAGELGLLLERFALTVE
jgi:hypothetical protein